MKWGILHRRRGSVIFDVGFRPWRGVGLMTAWAGASRRRREGEWHFLVEARQAREMEGEGVEDGRQMRRCGHRNLLDSA